MTGRRPGRPRAADIELAASIEAAELRFDEPPETEVRFFGEPSHESASGSDRTNLPDKVEAGVRYRNVRVDYRLASRLTEPAGRSHERARRAQPDDRRP
jgi:hypothetical protein